jgi:peptidyl-dipeptidase A
MLTLALCLRLLSSPAHAAPADEAEAFLTLYNSVYQGVAAVSAEAAWASSTDVRDYNDGLSTGAAQAEAAFQGNPEVIRTTLRLLAQRDQLRPLQVKQLEAIRLLAADSPGSIPDVVRARLAAESHAASVLNGYVFCTAPRAADGGCPSPVTVNDIDRGLRESVDLAERERLWTASKEIGRPLKAELAALVPLRNQIAREMGFSSYFDLMVADYGMSTAEMLGLLDGLVTDMAPLYRELQIWTGRKLAAKYKTAPPKGPLPASWLPNRWGQEWGGMVPAADLDAAFATWTPERVVQQSEAFYTSLGFPKLPQSFWDKSDLYPVPAGDPRKKNTHASAWHMDLEHDIRSLMSVEANSEWFFTSHHELGHIYYYTSYTRKEVPPVLREGANRGFHEGVGELITLAAAQVPYLQQVGILDPKKKVDPQQALLADALERTVVFIPWSAGVMTHFEAELYEKNLPPEQWQSRWWELVEQYQGITPPAGRKTDPTACDACTKTHIIDDPAGYYDYAVATVVKHQLHDHICRDIRREDPHSCNYYGDKRVGDFLRGVLEKGATEDWRKVISDATGEPLSTRAMVAYYAPLTAWLKKENARGR